MGIFSKKKPEPQPDLVNMVNTLMGNDSEPSDIPQWHIENSRDLMEQKWIKNLKGAYANSWINAETAAVFASTRIPPQCDACEDTDECKSCNKSKTNFRSMMSANQDSDWLVWELYPTQESLDNALPEGAFILFDTEAYQTFSGGETFAFETQAMSPIVIGNLKVPDLNYKAGMLHFADKFATIDSDYFIAGLRVPAGNYTVVAWIGFSSMGEICPMAMGVYGAAFKDDLASDLRVTETAPEEVSRCVNGSLNDTVMARMGNNQEHYAQINASFYNQEDPTQNFKSVSWSYQLAVENDKDAFFKEVLEFDMLPGARLSVADSLRIRGKQSIALELVDLIEKQEAANLTKRDQWIIDHMRSNPPGAYLIDDGAIPT
jgi:hypothetical protein